MKLSRAKHPDRLKKSTQLTFGGYRAQGVEGELCDMENMTSDEHPALASRPRRRHAAGIDCPQGMGAGEGLWLAEGRNVLYMAPEGDPASPTARYDGILDETEAHRQFAQLGDTMTVWPDKLAVDVKTGAVTALAVKHTHVGARLGSDACERSSRANRATIGLDNTPMDRQLRVGDAVTFSGAVVYPENNVTAVIREIGGGAELPYVSWTLYFDDDTFTLPNHVELILSEGIEAGDYYVDIGCSDKALVLKGLKALAEGNHIYVKFYSGTGSAYTFADVREVRVGWNGEVILFEDAAQGLTAETVAQDITLEDVSILPCTQRRAAENPQVGQWLWWEYVTMERVVPDMDWVFSHDNRLFGAAGDTVYVSAWGDPYNWNVFEGLASDSFATETGTPGPFTGAAAYGGYPRFFKEDYIFTLYGDWPGEYQLVQQRQPGVMEGSGRSLAAAGGRLFYLSRQGPCAYAGGEPALLSEPFGLTRYQNGVGATDDRKYYLNMEDMEGEPHQFVYDLQKGLWMREDGAKAIDLCRWQGELWRLGEDGSLDILGRPIRYPASAVEEEPVEWFAEFGDIAYGAPGKKRVTKLMLRLETEEGFACRVRLKFDSEDIWRTAGVVSAPSKRSVLVPIVPRRLDHFRLRIEGTGDCKITSLAIETENGSDR